MGVDSILGAGFDFFAKGKAMGGPIKKYQSGGLVTGGSGVKDDVLTMMQGGEYVIRKNAVNQIPGGVSTLDAINRSAGGNIPRFAKGGRASVSLKRDFEYIGKDKKRPDDGRFSVDRRLSTLGFFGAEGTKTDMFERRDALTSYKQEKAKEIARRKEVLRKHYAAKKGRLTSAYISAAMMIGASKIAEAQQSKSIEENACLLYTSPSPRD